MAVAFSAVGPSAAGAGAAASPLTFSMTCGAADSALYVGVGIGQNAVTDSTLTCTATYNAVAMTAMSAGQSTALAGMTGNSGFVKVFKMASPPSGAHNVVVTCSGTLSAVTSGGISVTGSASESALAVGHSATNVASATIAIPSTTSGNMCLAFVVDGSGGMAWTTGTKRYEKDQNTTTQAGNSSGATFASPGGTATMAWTQTSDSYAVIGFESIAGGAAPSPPPALLATRGPVAGIAPGAALATYT